MKAVPINVRFAVAGDRQWLWELKRATMREYVAAVFGWDEEVQHRMFDEKFDPTRLQIIRVDGQDVGMFEWEERDQDFFLARLEVLPDLQGKGIGSGLIAMLCEKAREKKKNVRLQVLRVNPARRLYERSGFVVESETPTHFKMKKEPSPLPEAPHASVRAVDHSRSRDGLA